MWEVFGMISALGVSTSLGTIASQYLDFKFYFKLVNDEAELPNMLPSKFLSTIPIVIFFDNKGAGTLFSSGPTKHITLKEKMKKLLVT